MARDHRMQASGTAFIGPLSRAVDGTIPQMAGPAAAGIGAPPLVRRPEKPAPPEGPARSRGLPAELAEDRESLFAEFRPLVIRLIRQYGDGSELDEDLRGEIYCRFCSLLDSYDPDRGVPLRPYLVRNLTASVYTYSRSHWRRRRRELELETMEHQGEGGDQRDPSDDWASRLQKQAVLQGLPMAIEKLPHRQRQVVIWRYYESRSFEEIAVLLKIEPATARSLLRHGLNNLRRSIAPAGGEDAF